MEERAEGEAAERYARGEQPVVVRLVERAEEPEVAHCREQVPGAVLGSAPQREEAAGDEGEPGRGRERDRRCLVVLVVAREHEQDCDARERQPERGGCRQEDGARAQPKQISQCGAAQLGLRNEAAGTALRDQPAVVARVAARDEHDAGRTAVETELPADGEAVEIRELHVEQHHIGCELADGGDRARTVLGLADHLESLRLEDRPRRCPEAGMVVGDHYGLGHRHIVAEAAGGVSTANRTVFPAPRDP